MHPNSSKYPVKKKYQQAWRERHHEETFVLLEFN